MDRNEYQRADLACPDKYVVYDARTLKRVGSANWLGNGIGTNWEEMRRYAIVFRVPNKDWHIYSHEAGCIARAGLHGRSLSGRGLSGQNFDLPSGEYIEAVVYGQE